MKERLIKSFKIYSMVALGICVLVYRSTKQFPNKNYSYITLHGTMENVIRSRFATTIPQLQLDLMYPENYVRI